MKNTLRLFGTVALAGMLTVTACTSDDESTGEKDSSDQVDLTSAPDANWTASAGVSYPQGNGDNCPEKTTPVPHGYEQTPQCAVIAAMAGQTLLATSGDDEWPEMANLILAPGEGKTQWAQSRALTTVNGTEENPANFAGFKITDYDDERAQVLLAVQWPDGTLTSQPTQLVWQSDDWRLVLPTQQSAVDATEIDNLDGFTVFGPDNTK